MSPRSAARMALLAPALGATLACSPNVAGPPPGHPASPKSPPASLPPVAEALAVDAMRAAWEAARALRDSGNVRALDEVQERVLYEESRLALAQAEIVLLEDREELNDRMALFGPRRRYVHVPPALRRDGADRDGPRRNADRPSAPAERTRAPDREFAIMLAKWSIPAGAARPDVFEMSDFNVLTMNSKALPGTEPLVLRQGERVCASGMARASASRRCSSRPGARARSSSWRTTPATGPFTVA